MGKFTVEAVDGAARAGVFKTEHGSFQTPMFMPVGTLASVKGIDCERIEELGAEILLTNTYHLWQRPGEEIVAQLGGIHAFMGWNGPVLSDSGGFQVYSLAAIRTLSEEGVTFRSHLDGRELHLTPEKAVQIQDRLGVDIAMVLDECPKWDQDLAAHKSSVELTLRWAKRCIEVKRRDSLSLFSITQGGCHRDLREQCAQVLAELPFDGHAIGGLSVGEPKEKMYEVLSYHPQQLRQDRIRYLMGVGTPRDLLEGVKNGVDLFDCVMPTRSGRFGRAFVSGPEPFLNIRNARFRTDADPLDSNCDCLCCRHYSRAYLHHLFRAEEMLGPQMLSLHNLRYYLQFMKKLRVAIVEGKLDELYRLEDKRWSEVDRETSEKEDAE